MSRSNNSFLVKVTDGFVFLDSDLCIRRYNTGITVAFTLLPEDIGRSIDEVPYHLAERDQLVNDVREVLQNKAQKECEIQCENEQYYLRRITYVQDTQLSLSGVLITYIVIPQAGYIRKRLTRAMKTAGLAWWEWNLENNRLDVHAEGECILGYDCEAIDHNSDFWFHRVPPEEVEALKESLQRCIDGEDEMWDAEHRYLTARGQYEWVHEVGSVSRRSQDGVALELSGTTMNIHKRKLIELDLRRARDTAEAALRAKATFLSTMGHEIRTPLNGINGMSEMLLSEECNPAQKEYIALIKESSNSLHALLNGILDYVALQGNTLDLATEQYRASDIIDEVVDLIKYPALSKHITIQVRNTLIKDDYELEVSRIRQVLINLLNNAVKFSTDGGEILVSVECVGASLRFSVKDHGIGIHRDFQTRAFEPFTQEDCTDSRKYQGVGLGLTTSRQLVELMGGTISFNSEPGVGSTFMFTIPVEQSSPIAR